MDRRDFLRGAALTTAASIGFARRATGEQAKRPNVLILMSDQHKRSCMGAYGDKVARTPNLDRLAEKGIRFTSAYCTNPVCTPSRASVMTGLFSHNNEAQDNSSPYNPEHKTIAHHFNAAGYMTGLIGKMHWVDGQSHGFEYRLEFNDWFQYLGPKTQLYADELARPNSGAGLPEIEDLWAEVGDPWKGHTNEDKRKGPVAVGRVSLLEEKDHFDEFVARESVKFLKRFGNSDQPFLLVSSFLKPHDPFMPAERFAKMFRAEDMELPESWGKADKSKLPKEVVSMIEVNRPTPELSDPMEAKKRMALYYSNLAQMDDCLGQVVQAVKDLGLENDTIICYFADHGEMLGELGLWQKFEFYEGSCGVPLLIWVPGISAGVCDAPVSLISICTTIAELTGVKLLSSNDGISLGPWIRNPKTSHSYGPVYAEYGLKSQQPKAMFREGDWKFSYWAHDIPELYNLKTDPQELHNLAGEPEYAARVKDMRQRLLAWHNVC
jgi:choline-sulfatase